MTTKYENIIHVKKDDKPLCNAADAKYFSEDLKRVTCRKCKKKANAK